MLKAFRIALCLSLVYVFGCKGIDEDSALLSNDLPTVEFLRSLKPNAKNSVFNGAVFPSFQQPQGEQKTAYNVRLVRDQTQGESNDLFLAASGGLMFAANGGEKLQIYMQADAENAGKLFTEGNRINPSNKQEMNLVLNVARVIVLARMHPQTKFALSSEQPKIEAFFKAYFETSIDGAQAGFGQGGLLGGMFNPLGVPTPPYGQFNNGTNPFLFNNKLPPLGAPNQGNLGNPNLGNPNQNPNGNFENEPQDPNQPTPDPSNQSEGPLISGVALAYFIINPSEFQEISQLNYKHTRFGTVRVNEMIDQFRGEINESLIVEENIPGSSDDNANPDDANQPQNNDSDNNKPNPGSMDTSKVLVVENKAQLFQTFDQAKQNNIRGIIVTVGNVEGGCGPCITLKDEINAVLGSKDSSEYRQNILYADINHPQVVKIDQDSDRNLNRDVFPGVGSYPHVFLIDPNTGKAIKNTKGQGRSLSDILSDLGL